MKSAMGLRWRVKKKGSLLFIKKGVRRNVENGVQNMVEEF